MKIEAIVVSPLMENCYIVYEGPDAILFDPGDDFQDIKQFIENKSLNLHAIFLTHGHFDHIGAASRLQNDLNVPLYVSKDDMDLINTGGQHAALFGIDDFLVPTADRFVADGEVIETPAASLQVIHTPGHSKGSVCYYIEKENILISGDTLFLESVGRTDLPGGDFYALEKSIREKLYILPDKTEVYPGHGNDTTIGHEKKFNPIIQS